MGPSIGIIRGLTTIIQPACWISGTSPGSAGSPCGQSFRIFSEDAIIAAVFNGGTKVGTNCAASASYIASASGYIEGHACGSSGSFCEANYIDIDVWKAWKDSAWTSTVTIDVYGYGYTFYSPNCLNPRLGIAAVSYRVAGTPCERKCITPGVSFPILANTTTCPSTKLTTITLHDDGTYTYT